MYHLSLCYDFVFSSGDETFAFTLFKDSHFTVSVQFCPHIEFTLPDRDVRILKLDA
jgi:hypothetical protein